MEDDRPFRNLEIPIITISRPFQNLEISIIGASRRFRNIEIPNIGKRCPFPNLEIPFLIIPPFFHSSVFPSSPTPSNLPIKKERQNKSAAPSRLWKNKTRE
ncbi:MAG: hypothetical protein K6F20_09140 [Bacteroidaceae bacterium]|nr:hypothetical protein [Bacteroidaceae bacterium]